MTTKTKYPSTEDYITSPNYYEEVGQMNETQEEDGMKKFVVNIDGFIGTPSFSTKVFAKNQKDAYATFVKDVLKTVMGGGVELIELETEIVDKEPVHSIKSITKTFPTSNIFSIEDECSLKLKVGEKMTDVIVPIQFLDAVYNKNNEVV